MSFLSPVEGLTMALVAVKVKVGNFVNGKKGKYED
jgi:hypothetical protein